MKAWEWATGVAPLAQWKTRPGLFQATPLMVGDTLFLSTPYNQVVALDPATSSALRRATGAVTPSFLVAATKYSWMT